MVSLRQLSQMANTCCTPSESALTVTKACVDEFVLSRGQKTAVQGTEMSSLHQNAW